MANPKISVIIPSYNHANYIKDAINSVLNQTFQDFELLIGDDNSTDNSIEIINTFNDKRIKKYFFKKNEGGSQNLNRLINLANTDYIAILNSDDYWEPTKLEKQYLLMENDKKIGACFTWVQYIDKNGKKIFPEKNVFIQENKTQAERFKYFFKNGNCLCHPSILIRKHIYDEIGLYKVSYRQIPDFYQWMKLIQNYPIHIINECLVNFRWFGDEKNTSGYSIENINRTMQEYGMLVNEFFDNISVDTFCNISGISEAKCVKSNVVFEYEKCNYIINNDVFKNMGKVYAYDKIGKLLELEENRNILENECQFTVSDYYKMGGSLDIANFNIIDYVEKVPDYIANSRGYKLLNRIYNSKLYSIINRFRGK